MKRILITLLTLAFGFTVACASHKDGISRTEDASGSRCSPEIVSMGETVTCSVSGLKFEDGDTVMIDGTGGRYPLAVVSQYDADTDSVTFVMPGFALMGGAPQATVRVVFMGGTDESTAISKLNVKGSVAKTEEDKADSDVIPSTASPTTAGCFADSDCVAGQVCNAGSCVAVHSTPPADSKSTTEKTTPPTPEKPVFSLDAKAVVGDSSLSDSERVLGVIKFDIKMSGAVKAAYLYAPFNRNAADTDCKPAAAPERFLAVQPRGGEIMKDSEIGKTTYKDFLTGEICDETKGNCKDYKAVTGDPISCRIDLVAGDLKVMNGAFYTRSNVQRFKAVLVVQSAIDDSWSSAVKTVDFSAYVPTVKKLSVVPSTSGTPRVQIEFDFENVIGTPSISGCKKEGDTSSLSPRGSGYFKSLQCEFKTKKDFEIDLPGVGTTETRTIHFKCGKPVVTLKEGGYYKNESGSDPASDENKGYVALIGDVGRDCWLEEEVWGGGGGPDAPAFELQKITGTEVKVPWVKKVVFTAKGVKKEVAVPGAGVTFAGDRALITGVRLPRNHESTTFGMYVVDYNGKEYRATEISKPYTAEIKLTTAVGSDGNAIVHECLGNWVWNDPCDKVVFEGSCEEAGDGYWKDKKDKATFTFSAQHVDMKGLEVSCGDKTDIADLLKATLQDEGHGSYQDRLVGVTVVGDYTSYSCKITYQDFEGNSYTTLKNSSGSRDLPQFGAHCENYTAPTGKDCGWFSPLSCGHAL